MQAQVQQQNQQQINPNQQQQFNPNQQQQQFNFNQQQQQQFNFNQQQQQFNQFNQNQQPMGNFMYNPNMFNMKPMMTPEQQKMYMELMKKQAKELGETMKKQRDIMTQIAQNRKKREEERINGELVLFFNHNDDLLSITIKANEMVPVLISKYMEKTHKNNIQFFFRENELGLNDGRLLYEIEGLVSGEEIIVKDKN